MFQYQILLLNRNLTLYPSLKFFMFIVFVNFNRIKIIKENKKGKNISLLKENILFIFSKNCARAT